MIPEHIGNVNKIKFSKLIDIFPVNISIVKNKIDDPNELIKYVIRNTLSIRSSLE